ncbi:hypothetical protein BJX65DRAFT_299698 [Aspergillus insuetus]
MGVTGCSSGLGEALVHTILEYGDQVVATARPRNSRSGSEALSTLKEAGAAVFELDVTSTQEDLDISILELLKRSGCDEFLISALRTNAFGPFSLARTFLPHMRAQKSGAVLFTSSVGVYYGVSSASPYTAGKGLLEAVVPTPALELAPFNIRTSLLMYGYYRTVLMAPGNIHHRAPRSLAEYDEMRDLVAAGCAAANGNQKGDPAMAAGVIAQAVRGTGPLDAISAIRRDCEKRLRVCEELKGVVDQTNL